MCRGMSLAATCVLRAVPLTFFDFRGRKCDRILETTAAQGPIPEARQAKLRTFGALFQSGALRSSLTLLENVGLPLGEYTDLPPAEIENVARFKLSLVGLKGFEEFYPAEISGGMCKRAGLDRALDPDVLLFDEQSAGLDPISSRNLDELMLQLRDSLGATFVVVTHEMQSIFAIADNSVFLDTNTRTMRAQGNPREMLKSSTDPYVREFLTRGQSEATKPTEENTVR